MFEGWFGDFGATRAKKAAAKKRALSKKTGKKTMRMAQTRKAPPRKYPRKKAAAFPFGPAFMPRIGYDEPYMAEEEGGFFYPGMGPGVEVPPPAHRVTIGKPTPHTQTVCGCKVVRMKNKREAIKCPGGPKGGGMFRFAKEAEIARAKAADDICTHVPVFGGRRGPLTPEQRAARAAKRAYAFKTSRGNVVAFKRTPSWRNLKKNVALYYHMLDKRARARGAKLRYMPSFADINGAYGDSGWGW